MCACNKATVRSDSEKDVQDENHLLNGQFLAVKEVVYVVWVM